MVRSRPTFHVEISYLTKSDTILEVGVRFCEDSQETAEITVFNDLT